MTRGSEVQQQQKDAREFIRHQVGRMQPMVHKALIDFLSVERRAMEVECSRAADMDLVRRCQGAVQCLDQLLATLDPLNNEGQTGHNAERAPIRRARIP